MSIQVSFKRALLVGGFAVATYGIGQANAQTFGNGVSVLPDSILEIDGVTVDSYQATASFVQNIQPLVSQRGTGLDGSLRSEAPFGWTVNANPFAHEWNDNARYHDDIMLQTGRYSPTEIDLALPAPGFSWTVGRTYSVTETGSPSKSYQGDNWHQFSQPEIVYHYGGGAGDRIYLVYGADRFVEFKRLDATSPVYRGVNGAAGAMVAETIDGHDVYVYWDQHGTQTTFFDPESSSNIVFDGTLLHLGKGQLWKIVDAAGNTAFVGHATDPTAAITAGYDGEGQMLEAFDSAGRKYTYTYSLLQGSTMLTSVEAFIDDGAGGWKTTGAKVDYNYHTGAYTDRGKSGWLREVTVTLPLPQFDAVTANGEVETYSSYYSYSDLTGIENQAVITGVVGPEGYRRYSEDQTTSIDIVSLGLLDDYMSYKFDYFNGIGTNNDMWSIPIRDAWIDGHADSVVFSYDKYNTFDFVSTSGQYDPEHASITTVTVASGKSFWMYFDEVGQPLTRLAETAGGNEAFEFVSRGELGITTGIDGMIEMIATPLACDYYAIPNPNGTSYIAPTSLRSNAVVEAESADGVLINIFPRVQSGTYMGFMKSRSWQSVATPSETRHGPHAIEEFDYLNLIHDVAGAVEVGGEYLVARPLIWKQRAFNNYKYNASDTLDFNETTFDYEFHAEAINGGGTTDPTNSGWLVPRRVTTTYPVVSVANNGSGVADSIDDYYRADNTLIFHRDETGIYFYTGLVNNVLIKKIDDIRLANGFVGGDDPADYFDPIPLDAANAEIHNATTYTRDEVGRIITKTLPIGRVMTHRYEELADGRLADISSQGQSGADYLGPFDYQVWNDEGVLAFDATVGVASSSASPAGWLDDTQSDPILASALGSLASLTIHSYNKPGLIRSSKNVYHTIPASGLGQLQTNYDSESYEFDAAGDMTQLTNMAGTVRNFIRDSRGYITERTITSINPAPNASQAAATTETESGGETDANGNPMGTYCYCGETNPRCLFIATPGTLSDGDRYIHNDIFGRPVFVWTAEAPFYGIGYDNQGRVTSIAVYSDLPSDSALVLSTSRDEVNPDVFAAYDPALHSPDGAWGNRVAYVTIEYDERGRVTKQSLHKLDVTGLATGKSFESSTTYDQAGREILKQGSALVKRSYDRLGREIATYELSGIDDATYSDASSVAGDVVERESHLIINAATGQTEMLVVTERTDSNYGASEQRGPLDTNTYTTLANSVVDPANLVGRAQISVYEYDARERLVQVSNFGTGGTDSSTIFDPNAATLPHALVNQFGYDSAGRIATKTDPLGRVELRLFDDAGRMVSRTENYVSPSTGAADENRLTEWVYLNGQLSQYIGHDTAGVQTTFYNYGPSASADDAWPSRDLLRSVTYPDGGVERLFYSDSNNLDKRVDPAGNAIVFGYDLPGRISWLELNSVAGFDNAVKAIDVNYSGLGQLSEVIQFADTPMTQEIDRVSVGYDGWSNVASFTQDPDGASGGFDPKTLSYLWELANPTGGRQSVRLTGMDLPGGANVDYAFESIIGSVGDPANMSRLSSITYDSVVVAEYDYMGVDQVAETRYPTNSGYAAYSTLRDASGAFDALDDFNRPIRSRWNRQRAFNAPTSEVPFYDISVLWDDNSNVTGVTDHVLPDYFNYQYDNDGLNRLVGSTRGAGSGNSVTLPAIEVESWGLSKVGNWTSHDLELTGDTPPDYSDTSDGEFKATGVFNLINEMTSLEQDTNNDGVTDVTYTRTHNGRGDLTDDGEKYKFVYDVLGRLVEIRNRTTNDLLSQYKYNGLGYRTAERIDTDEDGILQAAETNWRYFIYDAQWRLIEVYEDTDDVNPREVYVHHAAGLDGVGTGSYIDHIVLRDRDTDADGTLDEFHFYCQNWRADVVAIIDESGAQVEQIRYSPYGVPIVIPFADQVENGNLDFFDTSKFLERHGSATYEVRADSNLDGKLDFFDVSYFLADFNASPVAGLGTLSNFDHRFGYAGYWYVAERGLYHVRNRWYNPEDGRWLTRDPYMYIDGANLYQYVSGMPITMSDPFGLTGEDPFKFLEENYNFTGEGGYQAKDAYATDEERAKAIAQAKVVAHVGVAVSPAGVIGGVKNGATGVAKAVVKKGATTAVKKSGVIKRFWNWYKDKCDLAWDGKRG